MDEIPRSRLGEGVPVELIGAVGDIGGDRQNSAGGGEPIAEKIGEEKMTEIVGSPKGLKPFGGGSVTLKNPGVIDQNIEGKLAGAKLRSAGADGVEGGEIEGDRFDLRVARHGLDGGDRAVCFAAGTAGNENVNTVLG